MEPKITWLEPFEISFSDWCAIERGSYKPHKPKSKPWAIEIRLEVLSPLQEHPLAPNKTAISPLPKGHARKATSRNAYRQAAAAAATATTRLDAPRKNPPNPPHQALNLYRSARDILVPKPFPDPRQLGAILLPTRAQRAPTPIHQLRRLEEIGMH